MCLGNHAIKFPLTTSPVILCERTYAHFPVFPTRKVSFALYPIWHESQPNSLGFVNGFTWCIRALLWEIDVDLNLTLAIFITNSRFTYPICEPMAHKQIIWLVRTIVVCLLNWHDTWVVRIMAFCARCLITFMNGTIHAYYGEMKAHCRS